MATAIGCLPSAIDEEPVINIFNLLEYWIEEPPAHVTLALRYLGERKKKPVTEKQAQDQLFAVQQLGPGFESKPMPQHLRDMANWAEEQKAKLKKRKHG